MISEHRLYSSQVARLDFEMAFDNDESSSFLHLGIEYMQRLQRTLLFRSVYALAGLLFIHFVVFGVLPANAQLTAPLTPTRIQSIQLPLSGRTSPGSVTTEQNPVNNTTNSVNTLN